METELNIVKRYNKVWYENKDGFAFYKPGKKDGLKEVTEEVVIIRNDDDDPGARFIMYFLKGEGGPIMSADTIEEVEAKFEEAFMVSLYVKSLMSFPDVREKLKEEFDNRDKNNEHLTW